MYTTGRGVLHDAVKMLRDFASIRPQKLQRVLVLPLPCKWAAGNRTVSKTHASPPTLLFARAALVGCFGAPGREAGPGPSRGRVR